MVSKEQVQDFKAEGVYLFLTRDNVELRAKMLDHLKVHQKYCMPAAIFFSGGLPMIRDGATPSCACLARHLSCHCYPCRTTSIARTTTCP